MVDHVHLIDFTSNIHKIYEAIDILCFPSHLNAVGRPVLEAALFKVPSIVAITNPIDDTIIDNETGICIKPKDPKGLADAIEYFYSRPEEITRMGELAYKLALKNFDIKKNAKKILEIYEQHV
jgi:glycosyltransferase involved in cell wall biosynthesis